jgi:hypothetical protein
MDRYPWGAIAMPRTSPAGVVRSADTPQGAPRKRHKLCRFVIGKAAVTSRRAAAYSPPSTRRTGGPASRTPRFNIIHPRLQTERWTQPANSPHAPLERAASTPARNSSLGARPSSCSVEHVFLAALAAHTLRLTAMWRGDAEYFCMNRGPLGRFTAGGALRGH